MLNGWYVFCVAIKFRNSSFWRHRNDCIVCLSIFAINIFCSLWSKSRSYKNVILALHAIYFHKITILHLTELNAAPPSESSVAHQRTQCDLSSGQVLWADDTMLWVFEFFGIATGPFHIQCLSKNRKFEIFFFETSISTHSYSRSIWPVLPFGPAIYPYGFLALSYEFCYVSCQAHSINVFLPSVACEIRPAADFFQRYFLWWIESADCEFSLVCKFNFKNCIWSVWPYFPSNCGFLTLLIQNRCGFVVIRFQLNLTEFPTNILLLALDFFGFREKWRIHLIIKYFRSNSILMIEFTYLRSIERFWMNFFHKNRRKARWIVMAMRLKVSDWFSALWFVLKICLDPRADI